MSKRARTGAVLAGVLFLSVIAVALGQKSRPAPDRPPPVAVQPPEAPTAPPVAVLPPVVPPVPQPVEPVQPVARKRVEVVFVLDTTGSMTGLLSGAKAKIWSIANFIVSAQPTPEVRIGLVAYRDVGDAYVTRVYGLTSDLDAVHQKLRGLQANGGGDTPEHVSRALSEAVDRMQWSDGAMKMIFLVGDAPPAVRDDGYDWQKAVRKARKKEIVIHAVRCGSDRDTGRTWQAIATSANGSFMSIRGDGGVVATRATPMDKRLAELSRELDDTTIILGDRGRRAAYAEKRAAPMAPSAEADRAGYMGKSSVGGGMKLDEADGTDELASGSRDVTRIATGELPEEMKGMSAEERKAHVGKKAARRKAILAEMKDVGKQRDEWLEANAPPARKTGFDAAVEGAVEKQAEAHGLAY